MMCSIFSLYFALICRVGFIAVLPSDLDGVFDIEARNRADSAELQAYRLMDSDMERSAPVVRIRGRGSDVPPPARLLLPACGGNELPGGEPADTLCTQSVSLCAATPDPNDRMYWIYLGPPGVGIPAIDQWAPAGQACLSSQQAAGQGAQDALVVTGEDFRRLPLPAGRVHVQPASGRTLLNVPTNVYVEATVVVLPTTVLNTPVRVRATPVEYLWAFGDGGRLRTSDSGAPYPDLRTTHTYTIPGTVRLTLTTVYRGEYSVAGGPWLPIDGTAQVNSPAQPLTVIAARTELVDGTVPVS
jgi:hypothetical protein